MSPPETVIFDLGKVLIHFDFGIAARRLAELSDLDPESIRMHMDQSSLLVDYETGRLTSEQFIDRLIDSIGFRGSHSTAAEAFADIFSPIEQMIAFLGRVQENGLPVCLFSNTNELAANHVRSRFPFYSRLDHHVLSFEHGAMKPDPSIYEIVEQVTGRRGESLLYLDDRIENVEAGAKRGWQTIHHESPAKTLSVVAERYGWTPPATG